jgi:hypothetical protein
MPHIGTVLTWIRSPPLPTKFDVKETKHNRTGRPPPGKPPPEATSVSFVGKPNLTSSSEARAVRITALAVRFRLVSLQ